MGSVMAGMALADAGVGACHALAYPLGGMFRIPHGMANAVLLPYVMEFDSPLRSFVRVAGQEHGTPIRRSGAGRGSRHRPWTRRELALAIRNTSDPRRVEHSSVGHSAMVESALTVRRPIENNPRALGQEEATVNIGTRFPRKGTAEPAPGQTDLAGYRCPDMNGWDRPKKNR